MKNKVSFKESFKQQFTTKKNMVFALFCAIILLMAFTPLGYIQLPALKITFIQIPVIIGAIILGPLYGAGLGFVFGLTSFINNTFVAPGLTSFVFTPFYSFSPDYDGSVLSLLICFVPRILVGVVSGFLFRLLLKFKKVDVKLSALITGIAGSLTNTVFVLGGIYLLFGESYAAANEVGMNALFMFIMGTVATNSVPEAIASAILTPAVIIPASKYLRKNPL